MRYVCLVLSFLTAIALYIGTGDLPRWGDPESPAASRVSPYYLEHALSETEVPNVVSAVLADYRGFDTLLETVVVFCAGVAIIFLLRTPRRLRLKEDVSKINPVRRDVILTSTCRIVFPIVQLFALYVVAHGHHSPGGGFQGGVILGASFILIAVVFNLRATLRWLSAEFYIYLATIGVCIFFGMGLIGALLGGHFLDYEALAPWLPMSGAGLRSLSILVVEIGVALTVTSVMFSLYVDISSQGKLRRGL